MPASLASPQSRAAAAADKPWGSLRYTRTDSRCLPARMGAAPAQAHHAVAHRLHFVLSLQYEPVYGNPTLVTLVVKLVEL